MSRSVAAQGADVTPFAVPPLIKQVRVRCAPEAAFAAFTRDLGRWWPARTHSVRQDEATTATLEPFAGGRIYERTGDGAPIVWGTITAWQPPTRVAFTWHPGRAADTAQTIEVTFTAVADATDVRLVHAGWEQLGDDAQRLRDNYDGGWTLVFATRYAAHANGGG